MNGPTGPTGLTGLTGLTSALGVVGPSGAIGPAGPQGFTGTQAGIASPMGATGPAPSEKLILSVPIPDMPGVKLLIRRVYRPGAAHALTVVKQDGDEDKQNETYLATYEGGAFSFYEDSAYLPVPLDGVDASEAEALCCLCFRRLEFKKAGRSMAGPFWQSFIDEVRRVHTVSSVIDS